MMLMKRLVLYTILSMFFVYWKPHYLVELVSHFVNLISFTPIKVQRNPTCRKSGSYQITYLQEKSAIHTPNTRRHKSEVNNFVAQVKPKPTKCKTFMLYLLQHEPNSKSKRRCFKYNGRTQTSGFFNNMQIC